MKKILYPIVYFFMILASCEYNNEEDLYPNNICDTTNVTYSVHVKPIFQQSCYSCHSSPGTYYGNLDLENFNHIKRVADNGNLLRNIKHEPGGSPMPQGATKLSDCNILKIENWIKQGIPNN